MSDFPGNNLTFFVSTLGRNAAVAVDGFLTGYPFAQGLFRDQLRVVCNITSDDNNRRERNGEIKQLIRIAFASRRDADSRGDGPNVIPQLMRLRRALRLAKRPYSDKVLQLGFFLRHLLGAEVSQFRTELEDAGILAPQDPPRRDPPRRVPPRRDPPRQDPPRQDPPRDVAIANHENDGIAPIAGQVSRPLSIVNSGSVGTISDLTVQDPQAAANEGGPIPEVSSPADKLEEKKVEDTDPTEDVTGHDHSNSLSPDDPVELQEMEAGGSARVPIIAVESGSTDSSGNCADALSFGRSLRE